MRWSLQNSPFVTHGVFAFQPGDVVVAGDVGPDYNTSVFNHHSQLVVPAGNNVNFGNLTFYLLDRGGVLGDVWQLPEEVRELAGADDNDLHLMIQMSLLRLSAPNAGQQWTFRFGFDRKVPLRWLRDGNGLAVYWEVINSAGSWVNQLGPYDITDPDDNEISIHDYEVVAPGSGVDVYGVDIGIDFTPWWD
jgi:hypothetical protein